MPLMPEFRSQIDAKCHGNHSSRDAAGVHVVISSLGKKLDSIGGKWHVASRLGSISLPQLTLRWHSSSLISLRERDHGHLDLAGTLCALSLVNVHVLGVDHILILLLGFAVGTWSRPGTGSRTRAGTRLPLCGAVH
jgi:hypothetical protein